MLRNLKNLWSKAPEPEVPPEEPPVLELLSYGDVLAFRACRTLPVGESFEHELALSEGLTEKVLLTPRTRTALGEIEREYTADVEGSPEALAFLRQHYGPDLRAREGHPERRALARIPNRIRIRSRHLPHFQGLTHDLTLEGVRLVAEGEVAPGRALDLDLQLDHDRLPDVKARGEAIWSAAQEEGRTWFVGVRFTEVGDRATLEEYLSELGGATGQGLTRKNLL